MGRACLCQTVKKYNQYQPFRVNLMKIHLQRNDRTNMAPLPQAPGAGCCALIALGLSNLGYWPLGQRRAETSGWLCISLDPGGLMSSASAQANDSAFLHFCTALPGNLESKLCSDQLWVNGSALGSKPTQTWLWVNDLGIWGSKVNACL